MSLLKPCVSVEILDKQNFNLAGSWLPDHIKPLDRTELPFQSHLFQLCHRRTQRVRSTARQLDGNQKNRSLPPLE
jgi:hypothetical protein